jgi:hypothetical protein
MSYTKESNIFDSYTSGTHIVEVEHFRPAPLQTGDAINKKEADEKMTEQLKHFRCKSENVLVDSIYVNMFQEYTPSDDLTLAVIHRRYGKLPPEIDIRLKDFLCLFMDEFNLYCSINELENKTLNLTLMLQHKTRRYVHMLVVKTTKSDFTAAHKPVKADFYTYIPQYNYNK